MLRMLVCIALMASCVGVPESPQPLMTGRATGFAELRDQFKMLGAGSAEWLNDGVVVDDGPGALAIALTTRDYRVRLEAMAEEGSNSGVFVRSAGGVVYPSGVEVQIDPADPKNPTGSIYNRKTSEAPVPAFGEWFSLEIEARGNSVTSVVNGVHAASIDDAPPDGPIFALQAHHPGSRVHFRGLALEPL
jgi:hypothetical protein